LAHVLEVAERDVAETPAGVETAFEDDPVHMGMVAQELAGRLICYDRSAGNGLTGGGRLEVGDHAMDQLHQFGEEVGIVPKVGPQHLGNGEGEYPVRQPQQQVLR
jgi:hypothetical protein